MKILARMFAAIAAYFEGRADIGMRVKKLEARQGLLESQMQQLRTDMGKLKFMQGLEQVMRVGE